MVYWIETAVIRSTVVENVLGKIENLRTKEQKQ